MDDYRPRFDSLRDIPRDIDGVDAHRLIAEWRGLAQLEYQSALSDIGEHTGRATLSRHRGNVYELAAAGLAKLAGIDANRVDPVDYVGETWPTATSP